MSAVLCLVVSQPACCRHCAAARFDRLSADVLPLLPPTLPRMCRLCRYLVLFLKFIASVVPTIEYDYTMAAGAQQ